MIGDSHTCEVEGIGIMNFKIFDGITRHLKNVRFVPKHTRNLISLGVLNDSGYTNKIEELIMKICNGSIVIIKGTESYM